ncbi:MAG: alpha/beta hydrolase [Syntrophales bacterium]|jgi:pimeloyl-ACP methyl ester carboxylesterase
MVIFHEISGANIACWVSSKDFSHGKKTLFFIHGSGGDHRIWIKQYTRLQDEFNVAAIDLPGHGLSEGRGEQDVAQYVEWVRRLLDALASEKPVMIGHSLGAAISLVFAIKYGEMLSAIVPVGGGARMPVNAMILEGLKTDPESVIALAAKFSVTKENRERLSRTVIEGLSRATPDVLYGDLLACDRLDIGNEVASIGKPTLVMCGADDKMTPPALSQFLRGNIPGAQLSLVKNAGHMAMLENAEAFNKALKSFVESLPDMERR